LDFETLELDWLTEIVRSHQEAIQQVDSLPPAERGGLTPLLARRQLVLGSDGFRTLVELMAEHVDDMARYQGQKSAMPPDALTALEATISTRLAIIRHKIASIRFLLDSV